jgi:hypothetical protein
MRPIILIAAILLSLPGLAQDVSGTVKDSTGIAIPYASVNLRNRAAIVAFTTTDKTGGYVLHPPAGTKPDSLYLEIRCIGYKSQTRALTGLRATMDFTLAVSATQLQSVVVRNTRPKLRTSGDTLSYKASDFTNPQDRVIGDVIKRLPGISVATDGTISYNNKPVSGVYLGGDNLLDDKYNIATNTIPQSAVDQVQVIENHQPIKVLQNKVTSEDVALNLTFKKAAETQVLGQETIGAGLPGNYYADLNAILLKDQYKAINYLKGNNTGDDLQQELLSHNLSEYQQLIGNEPAATLLSLGTVNDPALARNRYFFDRSGLLNANNLVHLKNGLQLRVNASYLHDAEKQDYSQNTSIFLPGDTVKYAETQHNQFNPDLLHAQFTLTGNFDKHYLNNALLLDDNRWVDYSHLNTNGTILDQVYKDHIINFSNEFNDISSTKSGHLIQAYSYISHRAEPESRSIGPDYSFQQVNVPTWYTNNYLSLKIPGNIVTQSFKTGFSIQSQQLNSNLVLQSTNNMTELVSDSAANHVKWIKKRLYAEADYDIPGDKLKADLTLPLILQRIDYSDTGYALNKSLDKIYFNPRLFVKYMTGIENFVSLLYSYRNQTGSIEDIYHGYILKDYRTLYANNADLTLQQNQLIAAGYNYRKALTLFFASINVSYNHIGANNIASSIITDNLQQLVVLPYPNSTNSWTTDGTVSKYAFPLRTTFSGELKWQDNFMVQAQNGAILPFTTTVWTASLNAVTKLSDKLNFNYHLTGTQTNSHSPAESPANRIDQLLQQAEVDYLPTADLQFKLSGEHYFTRSQGNPDLHNFFADASAKYHFKKHKIDLQLDATNFLNVKTYKALYLSANTLTANSYTLPGRIILLKVFFSI